MRRWYVPVTMIGLGGIGLLVFSDWGRRSFRGIFENIHRAPKALLNWNEAARELDRIQAALNRVAESLEAAR